MQIYEEKKPHNTAHTSKEVFIDLTNKGKLIDEKRLVFEAIQKYGPVTSRRLVELILRERANITRSLYDLLHEMNPSIKEAFTDKCPITSRRVKYYSTIDWKKPELKQPELFEKKCA